jgi:hypothetical protein
MPIEVSSIHTNFITDLSVLGPTLHFGMGSPVIEFHWVGENMKHLHPHGLAQPHQQPLSIGEILELF